MVVKSEFIKSIMGCNFFLPVKFKNPFKVPPPLVQVWLVTVQYKKKGWERVAWEVAARVFQLGPFVNACRMATP